jgi:hypothetical protein
MRRDCKQVRFVSFHTLIKRIFLVQEREMRIRDIQLSQLMMAVALYDMPMYKENPARPRKAWIVHKLNQMSNTGGRNNPKALSYPRKRSIYMRSKA